MSEADRSLPAREARVYESLAVAPTAAAYGVGPAWIGTKLYWSDGANWLSRADGNMLISDEVIDSSTPLYVSVETLASPYTVSVYLPAGDGTTALVEFSTVPDAETGAESNEWEEWLPGSVTASTTYTFNGPVGTFKVARTGGTGDVHVVIRGA